MEAKELMIGDWIYIFDPDHKEEKEAYKVSEIREDGIRTFMFNETYEQDWFEPITLTREILELNGIDFLSLYHNDFKDSKASITLRTYRDNHFEVMSGSMPLRYVHELQHALRICGLNDLADNFKIS